MAALVAAAALTRSADDTAQSTLTLLLLLLPGWLQVSAVLAALLPQEGLGGLPLYALGASSGGAFVLTLPAYLPLKGARGRSWQQHQQ